jgi:hypothetical protein
MEWIVEHWDNIFSWIGVVVTFCSGAVKLTPTTKDDGIWGNVLKVLDWASVFNTPTNKAKLEKYAKKK